MKTIITRLALALEKGEQYHQIPVEEYMRIEQDAPPPMVRQLDCPVCGLADLRQTATSPKQYSFLFKRDDLSDEEYATYFLRNAYLTVLQRRASVFSATGRPGCLAP